MAELKTKPTQESPRDFLESIQDPKKKEDTIKVFNMLREITGEEPVMWGTSIIGFGSYHYKYASGREGDWLITGLSPRKQALTVYFLAGLEKFQDLLDQLGKYKTGKSCLYLKKLEDIDEEILRRLIKKNYETLKT